MAVTRKFHVRDDFIGRSQRTVVTQMSAIFLNSPEVVRPVSLKGVGSLGQN